MNKEYDIAWVLKRPKASRRQLLVSPLEPWASHVLLRSCWQWLKAKAPRHLSRGVGLCCGPHCPVSTTRGNRFRGPQCLNGYISIGSPFIDEPTTNLEAGPSHISVHIRSLLRLRFFISNHASPNFSVETEQLVRDYRQYVHASLRFRPGAPKFHAVSNLFDFPNIKSLIATLSIIDLI